MLRERVDAPNTECPDCDYTTNKEIGIVSTMTDGNTDDCEKLLPGNMSDAVSSSLQQQIFFQSRQGRPTTKSKVSHDLRANT